MKHEMNVFRCAAVGLLLIAILPLLPERVQAQNLNTSNLTTSPYNRYGYGRLGSTGNAVTKAMGDVGIALRSNQYTTLSNPASLTAIDTLTMLFTVGIDAQFGSYDEDGTQAHKWDAGFSGMSFQMPLWRNFAMSLSLTPYSMVGYYYGTEEEIPITSATVKHDTLSYSNTHQGVGGINNFMLGLGYRAFRNKKTDINVGVQVGWLFGTISHYGTVSTSSQATGTSVTYEENIRGAMFKFGAQASYNLNATQSLTLGFTFSPRLNLSLDTEMLKYSSDSISTSNRLRHSAKTPTQWGLGLTYQYARKLMATFEMEKTYWSSAGVQTQGINEGALIYTDPLRLALGVEYQPKTVTHSYWKACKYRAGFSSQSSYYKINDASLQEYDLHVGIGMPINKRSSLDFSIGYATLDPSSSGLVKENYLTFNLGLTFNEMMFFRNKLR